MSSEPLPGSSWGVLLRECHSPDQGLEHVREAVSSLGRHGFRLREVSALLHQARLEFELSKLPAARSSLDRAFGISESRGYFHFYWWDPNVCGLSMPAGNCGWHSHLLRPSSWPSRRLVDPGVAPNSSKVRGPIAGQNAYLPRPAPFCHPSGRKDFSSPQKQVLLSVFRHRNPRVLCHQRLMRDWSRLPASGSFGKRICCPWRETPGVLWSTTYVPASREFVR